MTHTSLSIAADPGEVAPERVPVDLGSQAYDVLIGPGLLPRAGSLIAPLLSRPRTVIVTDEQVNRLHGPALRASLARAGIVARTVALPPGEATKSMAQAEHLCACLIDLGVERGDRIIALGGGVIGDLTGFAAAIVHRGIGFIQVPTTLLAQVDSSVGGKTGVNLPAGKNLVGAFHQPCLVLADTDSLSTLSAREYFAGYAEVVKYGALGDADFFAWLQARPAAVVDRQAAFLLEAVRRSVAAKAQVVAADEREAGQRMLLNLGHTFGHALEACAGYDGRVLHGEAVAVGMVLALDLSARLGHADAAEVDRLARHLSDVGLPVSPKAFGIDFDADDLMAAMQRDKKARDGQVTLVLARRLGEAFVTRDVSKGLVAEVWRHHLHEGSDIKGSVRVHAGDIGT